MLKDAAQICSKNPCPADGSKTFLEMLVFGLMIITLLRSLKKGLGVRGLAAIKRGSLIYISAGFGPQFII